MKKLLALIICGAMLCTATILAENAAESPVEVTEETSLEEAAEEASQEEAGQAETAQEAGQAETAEEAVQVETAEEAAQAETAEEAVQVETAKEAAQEETSAEAGQAEAAGANQAEAAGANQTEATGAAEKEAAEEVEEEETAAPQAPAASAINTLFEKTFPSWNPESESLAELIAFVADCTDETSPNYLEPEDRIATFDMDGTILCEKAPVYVDYCLTMYRVLDDPEFDATEEERDAMQQIRDHAYSEGETFHPEGLTKDDLVASAFAGMSPKEFRSYVVDFADSVDVVGFEGMTYGQSFYKPMIEVINYLRANDFDVWMVSACEREVVRALVERFGIPFDHVIATDVPYVPSGKGDEANDEYNMGSDEEILLGAPLDEVECGKSGKPAAIAREIGKRPVLAFGNSSGDFAMLNYAEGNPDHTGMGFFVVCDDTEREYGSDEKAADFYKTVEEEGWTAFSMADDWKTIYGDGVEKTELPGASEEAEEELADAA